MLIALTGRLLRERHAPGSGEPLDAGAGVKIAVRELDAYYGERQVLHRAQLDIPERRITALIGVSGSGKTTFLRALNRLVETDRGGRVEGVVAIDGENVLGRAAPVHRVRARFGVVAQKPNPFPRSVFDNVAYGPRLHQLATEPEALRRWVRRYLEQVGLWEEVRDGLDTLATRLSLGQQQRLCIARALAYRPDILLMDEPCSALDVHATAQMEALMAELATRHTVVLATHNLHQVRRLAHHTAFFDAGRVAESGPTAGLYSRPAAPETRAFFRAALTPTERERLGIDLGTDVGVDASGPLAPGG